MHFFFRHPGFDELSDFLANSAGESRARIAAHLERCQACRDSLQFLRGAGAAARSLPAADPSPALLARVLASRADDSRIILPIADVSRRAPRRWLVAAAAAMLLAVLAGALVTRNASQMEAGTTSGTLSFTPSMPRQGQTVVASYRPNGKLSGHQRLVLRARLRSSANDEYSNGIPTVPVATLVRDGDEAFTARFVLPDNVTYAVLAVEDSSASVIDDNAGRDWEILVSDTTGKPLLEALAQRANDMVGRNWEEGLATARRMVALYSRNLNAWNWMSAFDLWLGRADDSVRTARRATLATFDSAFTTGSAPSSEEIGLMAWYADGRDSAMSAKWRARLLREAPKNSFAIQWELLALGDSLRVRNDTARTLTRLDTLWADAPVDRKEQVASNAASIAFSTADTALVKLWTGRLIDSDNKDDKPRATRWVATEFASMPALRRDGVRLLRDELDTLTKLPASERKLGETLSRQRDRHAATRRELLATLGRALVAAGDYAAGRQALAEASSVGWNLDVFRAVRIASLASGDTTRALTMAARIAVDPRTSRTFTDSVQTSAERTLGAAGWRDKLDSARAQYVKRMLADASARPVSGHPRIRAIDGRTENLQDLTNGKVTVVAFWSPDCGPAVEDLPRLNAVAARLAGNGVRVVSIVDASTASSELKTFLKEQRVTVPVYIDAWHEASRAFNQWGTPYYYVVDTDGQIRFDVTNSADEVLARAEALRLSEVPPAIAAR